LTHAGGGSTLTSLREGRLAMAGVDSPDVVAYATTARRRWGEYLCSVVFVRNVSVNVYPVVHAGVDYEVVMAVG